MDSIKKRDRVLKVEKSKFKGRATQGYLIHEIDFRWGHEVHVVLVIWGAF
jgi:hypothetical protein